MLIRNPCWDQDSITFAMNIARMHSMNAHTLEQKSWIIDQMIRALTHCPMNNSIITTSLGEQIEIELHGESIEYLAFTSNCPAWDKGIPV